MAGFTRQRHGNAENLNVPQRLLTPGSKYRQLTVYKFTAPNDNTGRHRALASAAVSSITFAATTPQSDRYIVYIFTYHSKCQLAA